MDTLNGNDAFSNVGNGGVQQDLIQRGGELTRVERAQHAAADKLANAAAFLRERTSTETPVGRAADASARRLEQTASYIKDASLSDLSSQASDVVRRYPLQSLALGVGVGLLLGRLGRR